MKFFIFLAFSLDSFETLENKILKVATHQDFNSLTLEIL